jgi:hypothetical protein
LPCRYPSICGNFRALPDARDRRRPRQFFRQTTDAGPVLCRCLMQSDTR